MAPLVQAIVNERESRDKRIKDKIEKAPPLKQKKQDDKKKKKLPEKQPSQEKPLYQVKKQAERPFGKYQKRDMIP